MSEAYSQTLPIGTRIGSYEIQNVLGEGGFGITYGAYDHVLNQTVAIKEYLPRDIACRQADGLTVAARSADMQASYAYGLERFLEEARTLAKFRDASIVRVLSYVQAHGAAYLVMDFEQGESLAQRLKRVGRLDETAIRALLEPLLRGLRCIHAQHFLHRDIKPANILLRRDGAPVLLDFGAARQSLSQQTLLLTAMVTPGYAPFEQYFNDDQQGPWTDLYGLGATLFHCMTGNPPIAATKRAAALFEKRPDPLTPGLESLHKDYSAGLSELVGWLLQPDAKARPQDTAAVLERLAATPHPTWTENAAPLGPPLDPAVLESIRLKLAEEIGPVAGVLVKRACRQTADPAELARLLASFLPDEAQRTRFIRNVGAGAPATAPLEGAAAQTAPTVPGFIPDASLVEQAKTQLAAYIGPIATTLVRKAATGAETREQFLRRLAAELPDGTQQAEFLRRMKA